MNNRMPDGQQKLFSFWLAFGIGFLGLAGSLLVLFVAVSTNQVGILLVGLLPAGLALLMCFELRRAPKTGCLRLGGRLLMIGTCGYFLLSAFLMSPLPYRIAGAFNPATWPRAEIENIRTLPENGSLNVGVDPVIEVLFQDGRVKEDRSIILEFIEYPDTPSPRGIRIKAQVLKVSEGGRRIVFKLSQPLVPGRRVKASLICMAAGRLFLRPGSVRYSWSFWTASDTIDSAGIRMDAFHLSIDGEGGTHAVVESGAIPDSGNRVVEVFSGYYDSRQRVGRMTLKDADRTEERLELEGKGPFFRIWFEVLNEEGAVVSRFQNQVVTDFDGRGIYGRSEFNFRYRTPDGIEVHFQGLDHQSCCPETRKLAGILSDRREKAIRDGRRTSAGKYRTHFDPIQTNPCGGHLPQQSPLLLLRFERLPTEACSETEPPPGFSMAACVRISARIGMPPDDHYRDSLGFGFSGTTPYMLIPKFSLSLPIGDMGSPGDLVLAVQKQPWSSKTTHFRLDGVGIVTPSEDGPWVEIIGNAAPGFGAPSSISIERMFEPDSLLGTESIFVNSGMPRYVLAAGSGWHLIEASMAIPSLVDSLVISENSPFIYFQPRCRLLDDDGVVIPLPIGSSRLEQRFKVTGWLGNEGNVVVNPGPNWFFDLGELKDSLRR